MFLLNNAGKKMVPNKIYIQFYLIIRKKMLNLQLLYISSEENVFFAKQQGVF